MRTRAGMRKREGWMARLFGAAARRRAPWRAPSPSLSRPGLAAVGLGAIYLLAFTSLKRQVRGLYGRRGILPVRGYLDAIDRARPLPQGRWSWRLRAAPSWLWLDASDRGLVRLCTIGQVAGAALALGVWPRLAAAAAWSAYLSFSSVGRDFLRFQWDVLLLEAGFHAMLGRSRRRLMRLLAVRLQLESGLSKLASRDPTWRDLTACCHHQETQPLPTPVGWYAHHLPRAIQRFATGLTLAVECGAPVLAYGPRRWRRLGFSVLTGFQGLIALTGNYAFFNALTVVLNLALVEAPARPRRDGGPGRRAGRAFAAAFDDAAGDALLVLGVAELVQRLRPDVEMPEPLARIAGALAPYHLVGSYGLFATMTIARPEIIVEGSDDGLTWRAYEFRYKPGDVRRPPRWTAPHQPRLDWQMWFAALGSPPHWFPRFLARLLEGSPDVLALLETNPFPDAPPRFVRAMLYDYKAADLRTHRRTGAWWVRTPAGLYFPPCTLDGDRADADGRRRDVGHGRPAAAHLTRHV